MTEERNMESAIQELAVESAKDSKSVAKFGEMSIQEIVQYLPHRYPFLLIDKVLEIKLNESILAVKNVTINEPFFSGHFPIKPVMPGVLIVEALAQAAAILAYRSTEWNPGSSLFYLGSIDNTRFKKMVLPGDQLHLRIDVTKRRSSVWKFEGLAFVNNELVCTTEMTSAQGAVK